ncbi:MAG: hypothetical protein JWM57_2459 [Phycisphaerales bacterium]|nr:hypothetical protein [Phycisphaerales bacterium]
MKTNQTEGESEADAAVSQRLRRLAEMPLDTSRLERAIETALASDRANRFRISYWLKPMRAVAASLALMAVLATLLVTASGGPVLASAAEMAKFHDDLVRGNVQVMQVDSLQAADKAIAAQWAQSPQLPGVPQEHAMACCMRSVKNKKVACVLLKNDGQPVTMTVANAADMQLPQSAVQTRAGIQYHVQSVGDVNMVMTEREGRWVCLVARLSVDRLMDLASNLRF